VIEPVANFIWFGAKLPWVHLLAIRSAAQRGGFERVVLHHADDLSRNRWWPELCEVPGFEAQPLSPADLFAQVPQLGEALTALYDRLDQPAGRANMVRAALLYLQGGVYLDLDTVTVASLTELRRQAGAFCGAERIVFPAAVKRSRDPLVLARAGLQTAVRDLCRRVPGGWRLFKALERAYPAAVNNAVLAAAAGHPFVYDLLVRMAALPSERQTVRFALGTHLLQEAIADLADDSVRVHDPPVFYPLGPEISEHWFRLGQHARLSAVLEPRTRVVHWYASVRIGELVPQIDPAYVRRHARRQLFSALAAPFVDPAGPAGPEGPPWSQWPRGPEGP
jgi:hypothetical protein